MGASCNHCNQEWDRDPALEVACPSCSANVGQKCERPSGHKCRIHANRDRLALEEVCDYNKCPAAEGSGRPLAGSEGGSPQDGPSTSNTQQATL